MKTPGWRASSSPRSAARRLGAIISQRNAPTSSIPKEVCRFMANPTAQSWVALKRICRYLRDRPRMLYAYPVESVETLDVYTDPDWPRCPRTRKSTSGGSIMLGRRTMQHWSSTHASIALSSGEAEFNGVVRGSGEGLGYQSHLADLGIPIPLRV